MASVLLTLRDKGPLYQTQLRRESGFEGSYINKYLDHLLEQQLITTWKEPYNSIMNRHYYKLTLKGHSVAKLVNTTLEALGLPKEDHM